MIQHLLKVNLKIPEIAIYRSQLFHTGEPPGMCVFPL
jgi:hypothetical protein